MPVVPITDMSVKDDEIAVSTNGRSFWVLDNLPLLRQMDAGNDGPARLLAPGTTHRVSPPMGLILPPFEGKSYEKHVGPALYVIDSNNINTFDRGSSLAPDSFKPTFTVN